MTKLAAIGWTQREDLAQLVAALGADNLRWVGGAVRDTLLGLDVADVDAATPLLPQDVMDTLRQAGIRTVPTGLDHGTITALLSGGPVEVTTLRKDVATDGRRATVAFASEWKDDAARRDFTINALYAHPQTLEISDYFGGLTDLEARLVRFIGDARQRIAEDHLRILRYFRFQARFGSMLDGEAEAACADMAATLKGLSRERVAMELLKLLGLDDPSATLHRMAERGVLSVVLPEITDSSTADLARLIAFEKQSGVAPQPLRRFAALLPGDPKIAQQVAARLRLSRLQRKQLTRLVQPLPAKADMHALIYREGADMARDLFLLAGRDCAGIADWPIPIFPLKGGQIVQRGIAAGPDVARILCTVEERWIAEGFPDAARVENLLSQELAS